MFLLSFCILTLLKLFKNKLLIYTPPYTCKKQKNIQKKGQSILPKFFKVIIYLSIGCQVLVSICLQSSLYGGNIKKKIFLVQNSLLSIVAKKTFQQ